MNRIDISTEEKKQEVYELFASFNKKGDIHKYFGITDNSQGCNYIKEVANEIGFDLSSYKKKRYCLECGKELKEGQKKFCSKSCAATYNNTRRKHSEETKLKIANKLKKEQHCIICDKTLNSNQQKYCSESCKNVAQNDKHDNVIICYECGKTFKTYNKERKFCSTHCASEYRKKQLLNKWLRNELTVQPTSGLCESIRKYLFEKHEFKCDKCGFEGYNRITGNTILQIHHLDGNSNNNSIENLQVLCPNCHAMTENYMGLNRGKSARKNRYK